MEEFEEELRQAFERRPAPPGLKRKLMARRRTRPTDWSLGVWQRLAAGFVLAAMVGGALCGARWKSGAGARLPARRC